MYCTLLPRPIVEFIQPSSWIVPAVTLSRLVGYSRTLCHLFHSFSHKGNHHIFRDFSKGNHHLFHDFSPQRNDPPPIPWLFPTKQGFFVGKSRGIGSRVSFVGKSRGRGVDFLWKSHGIRGGSLCGESCGIGGEVSSSSQPIGLE